MPTFILQKIKLHQTRLRIYEQVQTHCSIAAPLNFQKQCKKYAHFSSAPSNLNFPSLEPNINSLEPNIISAEPKIFSRIKKKNSWSPTNLLAEAEINKTKIRFDEKKKRSCSSPLYISGI